MARPTGRPIRDELIDTATRLIQQVGVNGFSYGALAKELGIKAPSIHHHFPAKEDLVAAVAAQYRERFSERVALIDEGLHVDRLRAYGQLFSETAAADRLCLCGAVSAEWMAVGEKSRAEVQTFFLDQRAWITSELDQAVANGEIRISGPTEALATALLAALEGSMLMSRADGSSSPAHDVGNVILSLIANQPN